MALGIAAGGRRINLRGCFNFRDVGGYRTGDGTVTRWRSLFRSDGLDRLTSSDRRDLGALGLSSVIDLRTEAEVAVQGPVPAAMWASVYELPLAEVLADHSGRPFAAEPAQISDAYFETLTAGVETIREILAILTDPSSYPAVICCPTGGDRTGIVTALILALIGVPDYLVISDFAASREATIRRAGRMRFEQPAAVQAEVDRFGPGLLGVVPEAMSRFLDLVRAEHGSVGGYAESIDMAGAVPYLRAALVTSSP
jgi:protein-tyrosine phosphatase